ncbi:hypothetical protein HK101_001369, partial [Irineochytrium annulatum]
MVAYQEIWGKFCESRGDEVTAVSSAYYCACFAAWAGDIDYVERVADPKYAQNPLLKENKLLAATAGMSALRLALYRGRDVAEVDRLMVECQPHELFMEAIRYMQGLKHLMNAWWRAYHGEYVESLVSLEALEQAANTAAIGPMTT